MDSRLELTPASKLARLRSMNLNRKLGSGIETVLCHIAKAPVRIALAILIIGRLLGGSLIALFESWSITEGLWYGVVTQTTTGYGDLTPTTTEGRFVAEWVLMWPAVLAVVILTGAVASAITTRKLESHLGTEELDDDFDHVIEQIEQLKRRYVQKHIIPNGKDKKDA